MAIIERATRIPHSIEQAALIKARKKRDTEIPWRLHQNSDPGLPNDGPPKNKYQEKKKTKHRSQTHNKTFTRQRD